ncbi:DSS1 SEM1 family protein [Babesia ovis]|uniref:DSS1 SEM1 family protein n=1 Tax=Babesia ovis TaxID=5869 RepID=A0A9W5TBU0_BABOV|nr:DSS1 SEM1 family protein [Babesia ovis]
MESVGKESIDIDDDIEMRADTQIFDEPDDELEEFDEIENVVAAEDAEISNWNDDWETAGWDDEDVETDFVKRILQELENYKQTCN